MKRVHKYQARLLAVLITSGISAVHAADNHAICSSMNLAALEPAPARSLVPGLNFGNTIALEIDVIAGQLVCN